MAKALALSTYHFRYNLHTRPYLVRQHGNSQRLPSEIRWHVRQEKAVPLRPRRGVASVSIRAGSVDKSRKTDPWYLFLTILRVGGGRRTGGNRRQVSGIWEPWEEHGSIIPMNQLTGTILSYRIPSWYRWSCLRFDWKRITTPRIVCCDYDFVLKILENESSDEDNSIITREPSKFRRSLTSILLVGRAIRGSRGKDKLWLPKTDQLLSSTISRDHVFWLRPKADKEIMLTY